MVRLLSVIITLLSTSCTATRLVQIPPVLQPYNFLDSLLLADTSIQRVIANKDSFNLQIIYTKIDRDANNQPSFTDYTFNVDDQRYFYPASTVKMPMAFLALEKLNDLNRDGLDKNTTLIFDSSFEKEQIIYNDPTAEDGRPTIVNYIKQVFLVSDNEAANRLYEFLGQQYLNDKLRKKGYSSADIRNRLSISLTEPQNRHTNPVSFIDSSGKVLFKQEAQRNKSVFPKRNTKLGVGYYRGENLVNEPFEFSLKNKISLTDLHSILRSVIFPEAVSERQRFNLTENDYRFLHRYMSLYPRESKYPGYDSTDYYDAYVKFLLHGSEKGPLPPNIRIFNKVGDAYGFLIDVAYIVDFERNIEFMLSCSMLCNTDGIFNDDKYDYDTIGFPFMKNLGQLIYRYEKQRDRKHAANLSKFKIDYSSPQ